MLTSFNTMAIYFTSLLLLTLVIRSRFEDIRMKHYFGGFIKIAFGSLVGFGIWLKDFASL